MEISALRSGDLVFYSERETQSHAPHSSLTDLIQGIWSKDPVLARKHLRARILSTMPALSAMDQGMLKVAAKRASAALTLDEMQTLLGPRSQWHPVSPLPPPELLRPKDLGDFMQTALALEESESSAPSSPLYTRDRKAAALLISPEGTLLGAARNTNSRDRTRHAEVNLIQGWWACEKRPIPRGCKIFVTLRCCRMCAGMIWHAAEDPWSLQVYWHRDDPGPMAQGTILQAGSPARRAATSQRTHIEQLIERPYP